MKKRAGARELYAGLTRAAVVRVDAGWCFGFITHAMFNLFFYKFIHIVSVMILVGYTFYAFAAQAEARKNVLMITGVAALLVLVSGIGLMHKMGYSWLGWVWVKLLCWLGLAAISGFAFRRRHLVPKLKLAALALVALAVYMVVYKPAIW